MIATSRTSCLGRSRKSPPSFRALAALATSALTFGCVFASAEEITLSLRGAGPDQPTIAPSGPMLPGTVFWESEGLRIRLAKDREKKDPVGIRTRFELGGDFDVQTSCELLQADEGVAGFGAGARLFMRVDAPRGDVVSLNRIRHGKVGDGYFAHHVYKGEDGKQVDNAVAFPTNSKTGRLRLRRIGDKLDFEVADGAGEFEKVHTITIGTGDVRELALTASTGGQAAATEVRWSDARIVADRMTVPGVLPKPTPSRSWIWLVAGAVALFAIVAVPLGFVYGRRRHRQ